MLGKKVPITDLAKMFGMSAPTFRKYFQSEIFAGKKTGDKIKPSRVVTDEQRAKVAQYLGYGMKPEEIALVLGYIAEGEYEQFRKDFSLELRIGKALTRASTIDMLVQQSKGGLIGATTKLEALSRPAASEDGPSAPATEYVGKKATAAADAKALVASGGKFAPRGSPRLVASGGKPVDAG